MGRLKIIAKSHMLGNTLPILVIFTFMVSAIVVSGDFSFLFSYALRLPFISNLFQSDEAQRIAVIALSSTGIVLSALIIPPLKLGIERWFFFRASGESVKTGDLFHYFGFSGFLRCQSAFWYAAVVKTGVFIFFQFPAVCVFGVLYYAVSLGATSYTIILSLAVGGLALTVSGLIFYFVYSTEWFMYYYIVVSNKTIKLSKAHKFSAALVKNAVRKVCLFKLSFLPWWLLCVFIFPAFYVWGYYKQSLAVLAYRNEHLK